MFVAEESLDKELERRSRNIKSLLKVGTPDGDTYYNQIIKDGSRIKGKLVGETNAGVLADVAIRQLVESEDTYKAFINEYAIYEIGLAVNLQMVKIASTEAFSNPTQWAKSILKSSPGRSR